MTYKRMFIWAAIVALFLLGGIILTTQKNVELRSRDQKTLNEIKAQKELIKSSVKSQKESMAEHRRAIRRLNEELYDKTVQLNSLKVKYASKFESIKKMNGKELKDYILADSGTDSTLLVLHLEERKECLEEKDVISKMFDLCSQKGSEQDSVIAKQDTVIRLTESLLIHTETERDIYSDEVTRVNKKLKRQKIINKIGIVAALIVVVIVGGN